MRVGIVVPMFLMTVCLQGQAPDNLVSPDVHSDRRVQAVVEQTREAEMLQAVDRLRLIHSAREKTVA